LADADLVLLVLDAAAPVSAEDGELIDQVRERRAIVVENKADLGSSPQYSVLGTRLSRVRTSALTGQGVEELKAEILRQVGGEAGVQAEGGFLTNVRHQALVRDAIAALSAAESAVTNKIPHEMLLMDLYNALRPLDEITGATTNDDILNLIFSTFCIGK
jgi:tRNA modification GTPase